MVEKYKNRLLIIAFILLVLGNSQAFMKLGLDRILLYLGLGIILAGSFLILLNRKWEKINKAELGITLVIFLLMSIGIAVQELYLSKKIVLILSNLILVSFAMISYNMVSSVKCIYMCSIGICVGMGITLILSLFFKGIVWTQISDIGIGFTCGLEHKNFFGTTALASFIGAYVYFVEKRKSSCLVIMLINVILIFLSSSRGTMILLFLFIVIASSYKIFNKIDKKIKMIILGLIITAGLIIFLNLKNIVNYKYRMLGIQSTIEVFTENQKTFWFGAAGVAHKDDNYVTNVRVFLKWKGTPEMALVAIMVKGGMLALLGYIWLFIRYSLNIKYHKNKNIRYAMIASMVTFLISMLVETYVMNINLVYCSFSYCMLSSLWYLGKKQRNKSGDKLEVRIE